jgi:hypothetical protein
MLDTIIQFLPFRFHFLCLERVDCLMLINTQISATGWIEWAYQKRNINHLRQHGVTQACLYRVTSFMLARICHIAQLYLSFLIRGFLWKKEKKIIF